MSSETYLDKLRAELDLIDGKIVAAERRQEKGRPTATAAGGRSHRRGGRKEADCACPPLAHLADGGCLGAQRTRVPGRSRPGRGRWAIDRRHGRRYLGFYS